MGAVMSIDFTVTAQSGGEPRGGTFFETTPAYAFGQSNDFPRSSSDTGAARSADFLVQSSAAIYIEAITRSVPPTAVLFTRTVSSLVLPSAAAPTAMHEVISRVRPLGALPRGWDNYDGIAPTNQAIDDAETFAINHLFAFEKCMPEISPASDGEVNFCWRNEAGLLDLGFYGDGVYSYYAKLADGREFMEDAALVTQHLPEEILAVIYRS